MYRTWYQVRRVRDRMYDVLHTHAQSYATFDKLDENTHYAYHHTYEYVPSISVIILYFFIYFYLFIFFRPISGIFRPSFLSPS